MCANDPQIPNSPPTHLQLSFPSVSTQTLGQRSFSTFSTSSLPSQHMVNLMVLVDGSSPGMPDGGRSIMRIRATASRQLIRTGHGMSQI